MVHAALVAAGIRAARYTSPHLTDITERFVIGRDPVTADAFERAATDVLDTADRLRDAGVMSATPTFFEATTVVAFELFRRAHVEVAVVEVGLGGRFDATNVIDPVAGAITTIGFDHQQHLGHTLEAIAFEKAGIIKPGMTVVTGPLPDAAMTVVRQTAARRGARLVESARALVSSEMHEGRAHLTVTTAGGAYGPLPLALAGAHQVANAVVAIHVLEAAAQAGVAVGPEAIEQGLETTFWPARLERATLADGRSLLFDAAHNEEGALALAAHIQRWYPAPPTLVIGVMKDKDVDGILRILLPVAGRVIATAAQTPRALPADELAARIAAVSASLTPSPAGRAAGAPAFHDDPLAAVEMALAGGGEVCVAGSIFLVGEVRERLRQNAILR
jgi:dihydrofolate synthase/folylpolyglutamate synthase